eukprot:scaffold12258_cov20-Tisochrysis_lutea.AAC.1
MLLICIIRGRWDGLLGQPCVRPNLGALLLLLLATLLPHAPPHNAWKIVCEIDLYGGHGINTSGFDRSPHRTAAAASAIDTMSCGVRLGLVVMCAAAVVLLQVCCGLVGAVRGHGRMT